jgi:hypothetical protein
MAKSPKEVQRGKVERRRARIALMPKIPCACGCGTLIAPFDANLVARRYIKGHQVRMNPSPHTGKPAYNRIGDAPLTNTERSRRYLARRYAAIDLMPKIPCACGCGTLIAPFNKRLEKATYANNHHRVGKKYPK